MTAFPSFPNDRLQGLHTQLLEDTMARAACARGEQTWATGAREYVERCAASPSLALGSTAILATVVLLVLRPPFVLLFNHDAQRPWRGCMQICWFSVLVVVVVTLAAAAGLPAMFASAGQTTAPATWVG